MDSKTNKTVKTTHRHVRNAISLTSIHAVT